jgi:hypothetical protein
MKEKLVNIGGYHGAKALGRYGVTEGGTESVAQGDGLTAIMKFFQCHNEISSL